LFQLENASKRLKLVDDEELDAKAGSQPTNDVDCEEASGNFTALLPRLPLSSISNQPAVQSVHVMLAIYMKCAAFIVMRVTPISLFSSLNAASFSSC
jgi:hypothetical protein